MHGVLCLCVCGGVIEMKWLQSIYCGMIHWVGASAHGKPQQVMGPDLIERMRALGAVANIQPSFVGTDSKWVQARIAPRVQASSYCWKVGRGVA
jgi:hypothetical protein